MTEKRNLLLIIPALQCGGAERVMVTLANYWASLGWKIHLLTHEKKGIKPFYPLASSIKLIQINALSLKWYLLPWDFLKRIWCIRRAIKTLKPEGVLSFLDMNNVVAILASLGLNVPVWVSERIDPKTAAISKTKKALRDFVYQFSSRIIVQTMRIFEGMPQDLQSKTCIIPNPFVLSKSSADCVNQNIIAIGRLDPQKGFDLLIKAFKKVARDFPEWALTIWGEGGEREKLEALVLEENLSNQVHLPGKTKDIFKEVSKASIFVLSSRFEGMPNALGEAMSMGLAAVATDCPTGPRELISHGKNGLLVPNEHVEELASALKKLMGDQKLREQLGNKAIKSMKAYDIKTISDQWERVFDGQA
jgi:GalNAc-alpha-(1->4)-GalNAc-alpha-(1->3)-diNAcBac-PP-undecaprenol alpha-1,4-N-acetyl-D-galactosaminyltransferase